MGPPSTKSSFDNALWIYIERLVTKKPLIKWDLKEIGEESSLFTCLEDFSADGTIKCDGFEDKFIMNKNTLC